MLEKYLKISPEVKEALKNNKPVVALESTIISHGMPYPKNAETALKCEEIIRDAGAIPATIAIIKGVLCVGLSHEEIEYVAKEGKNVIKVSRRDIPVVVANKLDGATTVAATMYIASLAGVKVFATGGIGGVHRGAEVSMDISADLDELGSTNVAVVCAGAKAILDLEKTLEYLETKGVPVISYQTDELPAFFCRYSGIKTPIRLDDPNDIAKMLDVKWKLNLQGGALICNPINKEDSLDYDIMTKAIDKALTEMNDLGIKGKEVTPFLLSKINELTEGNSLASNKKLVYSNCRLAALIAKGYHELHN